MTESAGRPSDELDLADLAESGDLVEGFLDVDGAPVPVRLSATRTADMPTYEPGDDPLWDQLGGREWKAIDGLGDGTRVYIRGHRQTDPAGRFVLDAVCVRAPVVTADLLRAIPIGRLEALASGPKFGATAKWSSMEPLKRQRGEDGDEFAGRVAEWYRAVSGYTPHPAKVIAKYSDVPVTTVHGWIREARLRGKLPPGRRGKAG